MITISEEELSQRLTAAEAKGRRAGLQSLDDKAVELYQRDKENGIRDRDSSALDMISAIRALIDKEAGK